tara:strand:+ start:1216 stop:1446 length:231 start_codon:yes stop_codon:yes gene_type:complete
MNLLKTLKSGAIKSWQTTLLGWLVAIGIVCTQLAALLDDDPATKVDWSVLAAALGLGGVATLARDNDKSSRRAGAE